MSLSRTSQDAHTRARLLRAAAETFAERGFRDATVREVCAKAQANVAAVNYHFGSKENLYLEALRDALSQCKGEFKADALQEAPRTRDEARARLRLIIRAFASRLIGPRPAWHDRLIHREMLDPSFALDEIVREFLVPHAKVFRETLACLAPGKTEREYTLTAQSILGQLIYHRVAGPVALKLLGEESYGPALVEQIHEHVVRFTERALGLAGGAP